MTHSCYRLFIAKNAANLQDFCRFFAAEKDTNRERRAVMDWSDRHSGHRPSRYVVVRVCAPGGRDTMQIRQNGKVRGMFHKNQIREEHYVINLKDYLSKLSTDSSPESAAEYKQKAGVT